MPRSSQKRSPNRTKSPPPIKPRKRLSLSKQYFKGLQVLAILLFVIAVLWIVTAFQSQPNEQQIDLCNTMRYLFSGFAGTLVGWVTGPRFA